MHSIFLFLTHLLIFLFALLLLILFFLNSFNCHCVALVFHLLHSKEECVSYNQTHISTIILIKYFWWGGGIQFSYVNIRVVRLLAGLGQGQFTWSHEMMQNKLAPVVEVLGSSPSLFASTKLGRQRAGVASNLRAYRPSGRCAGLGIGDCHESPWQIP